MNKDIEFQCSGCAQWLEAPGDMAGLFVECPKCQAVIKVPSESGQPSAAAGKSPRSPAPPPANNASSAEGDDMKGSTIRINLPPDLGLPAAPKRRFVIRRKS